MYLHDGDDDDDDIYIYICALNLIIISCNANTSIHIVSLYVPLITAVSQQRTNICNKNTNKKNSKSVLMSERPHKTRYVMNMRRRGGRGSKWQLHSAILTIQDDRNFALFLSRSRFCG